MRLSTLTIAAATLALPALASAQVTTDLFAGQHHYAGSFSVDNDATNLYVDFETSDGWIVTETHLYASTDRPRHHAPGRFGYSSADTTAWQSYTIPLADLDASSGDTVYVAGHAVVRELLGYEPADVDGFNLALPDDVTFIPRHPGGDSYWDVNITSGDPLTGTYDAWCVDTDRTMASGRTYNATVHSSLDPAEDFTGIVDRPENFDLVNYIINQGWIGQASPSGGTYTYGDVQRAIWTVIDDRVITSGLGSWSATRVAEIVEDAADNGVGFVPGCNDVVAVVLAPRNSSGGIAGQVLIGQVTFVELGIDCVPILGDGEETAWASGWFGFRRAWGSYLDYIVY